MRYVLTDRSRDVALFQTINNQSKPTNQNRSTGPIQQQTDAAIKDFSYALQLSPDFHKANINRAVALLEKGDLEDALADYTKTIELDPAHALAYANRGVVKVLLKKSDYAAEICALGNARRVLDHGTRASSGR